MLSEQCPECGSYQTYLLEPTGVFRYECCGLIVDDDYWMTNQPEITLGDIPPENVPDDIPDYLD